MTTMNLTTTETANYGNTKVRQACRAAAGKSAKKHGKRFAQIVACDGRILDVLEVM